MFDSHSKTLTIILLGFQVMIKEFRSLVEVFGFMEHILEGDLNATGELLAFLQE